MATEELKYWSKGQKKGRPHTISPSTDFIKGIVASVEVLPKHQVLFWSSSKSFIFSWFWFCWLLLTLVLPLSVALPSESRLDPPTGIYINVSLRVKLILSLTDTPLTISCGADDVEFGGRRYRAKAGGEMILPRKPNQVAHGHAWVTGTATDLPYLKIGKHWWFNSISPLKVKLDTGKRWYRRISSGSNIFESVRKTMFYFRRQEGLRECGCWSVW